MWCGLVACCGGLRCVEVVADFGIFGRSVNRWMCRADVDDGVKGGVAVLGRFEVV